MSAAPQASQAAVSLRVALLLGSTRTEGPPRPANVGARVGKWMQALLTGRGHHCDVIDPVGEVPGCTPADLPLLRKPHFAYSKSSVPAELDALATVLADADAYVVCTPEYNHAPSPALLNILNHFGSSIFSFKPSLIVSYSQGQWGGTRAAHALRPTLSELGCLPVSAMVHVPKAHEVLDADGTPAEDGERWESYAGRGLSQLQWWGEAARAQRERVDPLLGSPPLRSAPSQRNAPGDSA